MNQTSPIRPGIPKKDKPLVLLSSTFEFRSRYIRAESGRVTICHDVTSHYMQYVCTPCSDSDTLSLRTPTPFSMHELVAPRPLRLTSTPAFVLRSPTSSPRIRRKPSIRLIAAPPTESIARISLAEGSEDAPSAEAERSSSAMDDVEVLREAPSPRSAIMFLLILRHSNPCKMAPGFHQTLLKSFFPSFSRSCLLLHHLP